MKNFLTKLFDIEKENLKEKYNVKTELQDGLYMVKVRFLDNPGSDDINTRFKPLEKEKYGYKSDYIREKGIIIKYVKGLDYVIEYKTGIKIPLYYIRPGKKTKINKHNDKKGNFFWCVILSYYNLRFTGKDYGKTLPIEMFLDDVSAYHTKNLLEIPSNELDEIMKNYLNDDEMECMIEALNDNKNKYYVNINHIKEELNETLDTYEQEKNSQIKRNYEKYYYIDDSVKKGRKKRLFRK